MTKSKYHKGCKGAAMEAAADMKAQLIAHYHNEWHAVCYTDNTKRGVWLLTRDENYTPFLTFAKLDEIQYTERMM